MPDGAYFSGHSSHTDLDSFATTSDPLGMAFNQTSRSRPPPGIFVPASSSSSRSVGPPCLSRDQSDPAASFVFHSSPPLAHANQTTFAAPRAMQPYPRLTSPQPSGEGATGGSSGARSPSPTKRSFNFPMGDPSERWNSIGQVSGGASRAPAGTSQRKQSIHSGLSSSSAAAEPFLGYNELFSPNGSNLAMSEASKSANAAALSTSDPMNVAFRSASSNDSRGLALSSSQDQEHMSHRFGLSPGQYGSAGNRDELAQMGANPRSVGHDDFNSRPRYGAGPGPGMLSIPNPGNLSPRSMMQLQHQHVQMQSQLHHQQQQSSHQSPLGPQHQQQQQQQQEQYGLQNSFGNPAGMPTQGGPPEEITTVFIVGFPDDMTEREFANMFLFAKGFEASTLKIPAGLGTVGPSGRAADGSGPLSAGPGGPYQAVNMPGSGVFDLGGNAGPGWDDQNLPLALRGAGAGDAFSSLANMGGMLNAFGAPGLGGAAATNNTNAAAAGKIKQIIGFAKFRTRTEALEARDALNGRKVDAEKGCVLKTEMAKKNLHTKQRPVLSAPGYPEGAGGPMCPLPAGGAGPSSAGTSHPPPPPFALGGPFDPRAGPQMNGPGGQAGRFSPFGKGPAGGFEPFNGPGSGQADLLSPHEMFAGPDFFTQGGAAAALRSSIGPSGGSAAPSQQQQQQQQQPQQSQQSQSQQPQQGSTGVDKWGGSLGPIDYYGPEGSTGPIAAPPRGASIGPGQTINTQSSQRSDWPALGSPPPSLYGPASGSGMAGSAQRPGFQRQGSRGTSIGAVGSEQVAAGPGSMSLSKPDDGAKADTTDRPSSTPSSAGPDAADYQQQQASVTTRLGSLKLGSPPADDDGIKPPPQVPSPDLPSPTGRNVHGDNHPPVNTLFVGNLPSNASSAVLSQIEDQLRAVFSSCQGFRQFSFRLKSNGPMCFVEFEDVYTASKAMSELNGHSLGGAIKNGGIRLSFSKNPLFRMNSNSAMNMALNGGAPGSGGAGGSGSSASTAPTPDSAGGPNAPMSLGSASESISVTARR
ncbi:uncharacterized protein UHO2_05131 [Ustilago hordei]|uniref:Related to WHI3-involved in regulation of cell size n=1 Tax=Ustilago hordei TaxID=120017 RepID=I2FQV8_USTHO|nr:uncharacterized protein UHO2_05131 [Ustilago hordei]CCF49301.1 related to WHI3-involved in regulation of cell size [Ustilago hordei]SYW79951.1 related to WHI3 - involved in regulation of cell size [Ustilago hordei]